MAKQAKAEKKVVLIGGRFRAGSSIGNLLAALEDGKWHSVAALKSEVRKGGSVLSRLRAIGRIGRQMKKWGLEWEGENRVKKIAYSAKPAPKATAKAAPKPKAKATAKPKSKPSTSPAPKASVQDVPVSED